VKDLIKKILKEEFNDVDWWGEIPRITPDEEFLYDLMSSLKMVESKKRKNWMLYEDENGKILMADDINTGTKKPKLWVDYDEIWIKLKDYGLQYEEIKTLCMRMLEVTHKRKVLTAQIHFLFSLNLLEVTHKRKVLTAKESMFLLKTFTESNP
jgi:hypothetical protein